jgi:hypothetical protein
MDAITLGPLAIDPEGRLAPKQADRPLEFTFDWRGRRCRAEGWSMGLTPDHRIRFEADLALVPPTNAPELVAALVRFVLALDPYLDRLEAAGAGWAVGSAKT